MEEKLLFIFNPNAGNGRAEKLLPKLKSTLRTRAHNIEIAVTGYTNHAYELVKDQQKEFSKIIVVGGDGTLNEALNGCNEEFKAVLGVIPVGSGNDFAKTAGLTGSFEENIKNVTSENVFIRTIDFGELFYSVNETGSMILRRFINSAGIGFDAVVSDKKNHVRNLRGLLQYIVAVKKALKQFNNIEVHSNFDGAEDFGEKLLIAISNGKTYGGGIRVNPYAEVNDGLLDACIINPLSVFRVAKDLPKFITGKHEKLTEVRLFRFKEAELTIPASAYIHADGEVISRNAKKILIKINSRNLKFIFVPGRNI